MHIRVIAKEVLKKFPKLEEDGFTSTDINVAAGFYYEEAIEQMLTNVNDVFISFKNIGYFYTSDVKLLLYVNDLAKYRYNNPLKLDRKELDKSVYERYDMIAGLFRRKMNYFEDKLKVVNEKEDIPLTHYFRNIHSLTIEFYSKLVQYVENLKQDDARAATRNLEKQISNFGRYKEQSVQKRAHRRTFQSKRGSM